MDPEMAVTLLSERLKLVRTEYNLSQEDMAGMLGVSKKTLIQVEKGRTTLSWTVALALCALFRESEVIRNALGDESLEVLRTLTFGNLDTPREHTLGGRVWWLEVERLGGFRIQQNIISGHYRILDEQNRRWASSFALGYIQSKLRSLAK